MRNSGLTSSTTRYWFNCVNMIEICRWPKASYSASSIICGVTPSREAVVAVDHDSGLQAFILLVAGHVAQLRQGFELRDQLWHPLAQFLGVGILQAVLILRAADAGFDRQILDRLHEQGDALDLGQRGLQTANHLEGRELALLQRLEIDLNASAVERRVGAVDADE